jgi:hypothetical protein
LSFREPHYGVFWLPLLPKPLGAMYLRARGRSPTFLLTSITYTTQPWVRRILRRCGFSSIVDRRVREAIAMRTHRGWKGTVIMLSAAVLSAERLARLWAGAFYCSRAMTPMIGELCWKPFAEAIGQERTKGQERKAEWR